MIKKILLFLLFFLSSVTPLKAEISLSYSHNSIYVHSATTNELNALFKQYGYTRFRALKDNAYPKIYVSTLPKDFQTLTDLSHRNELFIRILTPLALKINQEIANERASLLRLERAYQKQQALSPKEQAHLEGLALKYDYFTRAKNSDRIAKQISALKERIDIIPPSLLIAIAAMESNWGFSRPAAIANSLYKEKVWYTNEGLEPNDDKDDGYRFKIFNSLIESMRSYALMFNSNINFANIRYARAQYKLRHDTLLGESIAYSLVHASHLKNYAGIINYLTAFYDLIDIDNGHLINVSPPTDMKE